MSTRRLIITAMLCGLAILIAGGAFLVRTARNKDELTLSEVYSPGQSAAVDGTTVTVRSGTVRDGVIDVAIDISSPDPLTDVADGFTLADRGTVSRPVTGGTSPCRGLAAVAGSPTSCTLRFDAAPEGSFFVAYARGGKQVQWRLG